MAGRRRPRWAGPLRRRGRRARAADRGPGRPASGSPPTPPSPGRRTCANSAGTRPPGRGTRAACAWLSPPGAPHLIAVHPRGVTRRPWDAGRWCRGRGPGGSSALRRGGRRVRRRDGRRGGADRRAGRAGRRRHRAGRPDRGGAAARRRGARAGGPPLLAARDQGLLGAGRAGPRPREARRGRRTGRSGAGGRRSRWVTAARAQVPDRARRRPVGRRGDDSPRPPSPSWTPPPPSARGWDCYRCAGLRASPRST